MRKIIVDWMFSTVKELPDNVDIDSISKYDLCIDYGKEPTEEDLEHMEPCKISIIDINEEGVTEEIMDFDL